MSNQGSDYEQSPEPIAPLRTILLVACSASPELSMISFSLRLVHLLEGPLVSPRERTPATRGLLRLRTQATKASQLRTDRGFEQSEGAGGHTRTYSCLPLKRLHTGLQSSHPLGEKEVEGGGA